MHTDFVMIQFLPENDRVLGMAGLGESARCSSLRERYDTFNDSCTPYSPRIAICDAAPS